MEIVDNFVVFIGMGTGWERSGSSPLLDFCGRISGLV